MRIQPTLFAIAIVGLMAAPVAAIVKRHDIPDAAYLARESDYPALFALYRTKAGHRDCIATLIAPQWAVTASYCTDSKKLVEATGEDGSGYEVEIAGRTARIDRLVRHPGKWQERDPDIALLHLAEPVAGVRPIPLYRADDEVGRVVVMPGWGGSGDGEKGLVPEDGLFRVAENIVAGTHGKWVFWGFDKPGGEARSLTLEGISGPGDSGGPALIMTQEGYAIAGVSSQQDTKDGPEGVYGVDEYFVRVSAVAEWIDQVLAEPSGIAAE